MIEIKRYNSTQSQHNRKTKRDGKKRDLCRHCHPYYKNWPRQRLVLFVVSGSTSTASLHFWYTSRACWADRLVVAIPNDCAWISTRCHNTKQPTIALAFLQRGQRLVRMMRRPERHHVLHCRLWSTCSSLLTIRSIIFVGVEWMTSAPPSLPVSQKCGVMPVAAISWLSVPQRNDTT